MRRFLCSNTGCDRRTFVEQVDGLTNAYARTTRLLREILEKIALALARQAGSRLAFALGVSVGRSTLLRLVRALPDLRQEWSLCSVSTISRCGDGIGMGLFWSIRILTADVDVLPDRKASTVAEWLAVHPGTEVISP
ncbi:hypothetical protein R3Q16_22145 [Rhodococcus globerulus]|uniref:Transposase n=1 Tax=Rhodococcus globerulus TaxID=33008 RepID=A0ABU4BZ93_RHOGO|nr:hypothetical protein [Rhodococcus globerulus]MDV6269321.1 hypothetical protein [Rhodococcus globerulus]